MVILLVEVSQLAEVDIQLVHAQLIMYGMRLVHLVSVIVVSNIRVVEQDMQEEAVQLVEENTRVVPVPPITHGMVVLVSVIVVSNILVVVLVMQEVAEQLVEENTRVVPVLTYMLGMEVLVPIHIITNVLQVLMNQVHLVHMEHLEQYQKHVLVEQQMVHVIPVHLTHVLE